MWHIILCDFDIFVKYPALVLYYSGAAAGAFFLVIIFCTLDRGKLTTAQVETCTVYEKSTLVSVFPAPSAPLQIKFSQFCYIN